VMFGGLDVGVLLISTVDSTVGSMRGSSLPRRASSSRPALALVGEPGRLTSVPVSIGSGRRSLGPSSPSILLPGEPRAVRMPSNQDFGRVILVRRELTLVALGDLEELQVGHGDLTVDVGLGGLFLLLEVHVLMPMVEDGQNVLTFIEGRSKNKS
jgi:hypothetical protein